MSLSKKVEEILFQHYVQLCHPLLSLQTAHNEAKKALMEAFKEVGNMPIPSGGKSMDFYDGWVACRQAIRMNMGE